jgi:hypothetical protein
MLKLSRVLAGHLVAASACVFLVPRSLAQVSVRSVKVLGGKDTVEVEVQASDRIIPETQVLTGPDRLVVDFPNALPGSQVRNQSIDRADVKDVRVGLFQAKPPVTRVVLDLKSARPYQVFPHGRTVMILVSGTAPAVGESGANSNYPQAQRPGLLAANYTTGMEPASVSAQKPLQVSYRDGMLGISSNRATLSEVLYAIQQRTGADISIPAGAEQERVVAEIGPAPAAEALAQLLKGSRFNFLILNSAHDPRQLDRVVITARTEGGFVPPPPPPPPPAPAQQPDEDPLEEELAPPFPEQPPAPPNQENAPVPPPPVERTPPPPPPGQNGQNQ